MVTNIYIIFHPKAGDDSIGNMDHITIKCHGEVGRPYQQNASPIITVHSQTISVQYQFT